MSNFNSINTPVDPLKLIRIAYGVRETDRNPFNYCTSAGDQLESLAKDCTHITVPSGQSTPPFYIFPRSIVTNYRSKRGSGPHYPLDAICFLLERKDDSYTNYLQDVRRFGLTVISLPDKKELMEYLMNGTVDLDLSEYSAIDLQAELPIPLMLFPDSLEAVREQEQKATFSTEPAATTTTTNLAKKPRKTDSEPQTALNQPNQSLESSLIRPIQTTETLFHCDKDFSALNLTFKNYMSTLTASSTNSKKPSSLLDQISSMNANSVTSPQKSIVNPVWIIILPAGGGGSSSALLTLHNVKDFISDSKYISVNDARARAPKPSSIRIEHSGNTFEFIDNPARLTMSDWSRVLACFTLTSTWQFKGWKWETPLELFQHILGFHVYFDDLALDPTVAGWNVTKLAISRNKRHLDATAVMAFWNRINDTLKTKKQTK